MKCHFLFVATLLSLSLYSSENHKAMRRKYGIKPAHGGSIQERGRKIGSIFEYTSLIEQDAQVLEDAARELRKQQQKQACCCAVL